MFFQEATANTVAIAANKKSNCAFLSNPVLYTESYRLCIPSDLQDNSLFPKGWSKSTPFTRMLSTTDLKD